MSEARIKALENQIRALTGKISTMERKNRQPTRPHNRAGKESAVIRRNPSNVKPGDIKSANITQYKDGDESGIIISIDGKNAKIEATEI